MNCNVNYFEVLYCDCFDRKHVHLLATKETTPYKTNYAYATGFNGCKIIDYKQTDREHYRANKIQFFIDTVNSSSYNLSVNQ